MGYSVLLMGEAMPLVLSPAGQIHGRTAREAGPHRPAGIDRTDAPARPLRCAAIGGEWLGEVYGGLNRFFVDLLNHLPAAGVEVAATAAGKKSEADPAGTSFSPAHDFLPRRLWRARREVRRLAAGADLVACHFALYGWPALPLGDRPLVVHFHGPWTGESTAEGAGRVNVFAKRAIERAVYRPGGPDHHALRGVQATPGRALRHSARACGGGAGGGRPRPAHHAPQPRRRP